MTGDSLRAPQPTKRDLIETLSLFDGLPDGLKARIVAMAVTCRLETEELLFSKGDPGDALYGILSGAVRISITSADGKEVVLNIAGPGEVFGEIALLDGQARSADATATMATELVMVRRSEFQEYLRAEPQLSQHLLTLLCQRLRSSNEQIEDVAFLSLPARLAKKLLSLTSGIGNPEAEIKLPQHKIAQMVGGTRESVNKHLQRWRREGWIDLRRSTIVVLDPEALRDVVEGDVAL